MKSLNFVYLTRVCLGVLLVFSFTGCNTQSSQSASEGLVSLEQARETSDQIVDKEVQQLTEETSVALNTLKEGNPYELVGFDFGDPIDEDKVERTGAYLNGGEIFTLKQSENKELLLFFSGPNETFSGLSVHQKGDFFGIMVGEDGLQEVKDALGEPAIYEEEDDMYGMPLAVYYFEKASLFIRLDTEHKITSIGYIGKLTS